MQAQRELELECALGGLPVLAEQPRDPVEDWLTVFTWMCRRSAVRDRLPPVPKYASSVWTRDVPRRSS